LKNNVFENKDCFNSLEEKINGIGSLCYHESMSSNSKKQVQELMQKIWENQRGAFYIKAGVLNILSDFFSRLREVNVQSNKQSVHEVICDLEKCLIGNVTGSLPNVKQLASNHSTSPSTLSRHFKKKHGVNISTYFMRKKREYVNQLMQGETKNTKEVAAKVGYYNVNSFKTTFQKHLPDKRA
jgi:YesN/AraC family two-component response regulator